MAFQFSFLTTNFTDLSYFNHMPGFTEKNKRVNEFSIYFSGVVYDFKAKCED